MPHIRYRCTRDRQVSRQTLHIRLTSFSPPNSSMILLSRPISGLPLIQPKTFAHGRDEIALCHRESRRLLLRRKGLMAGIMRLNGRRVIEQVALPKRGVLRWSSMRVYLLQEYEYQPLKTKSRLWELKAYLRALVLRLLRLSLRTRFFLHLALIFAQIDCERIG